MKKWPACQHNTPVQFSEQDREPLKKRIDNRLRQIEALQFKIDTLKNEIKIYQDIIDRL